VGGYHVIIDTVCKLSRDMRYLIRSDWPIGIGYHPITVGILLRMTDW
jgi:hypothetical protein